ncbi:unnamed protein product [Linum trigynum]|uniref:Secreted protein n=1 Tax=Linum trigynum TaxID=586398 RepID=A0AAV2GDQ7_9ROSI
MLTLHFQKHQRLLSLVSVPFCCHCCATITQVSGTGSELQYFMFLCMNKNSAKKLLNMVECMYSASVSRAVPNRADLSKIQVHSSS